MTTSSKASQPLIALEHVGHEFDGGRIVALRDINLNFGGGESVAIVGASGSGKTTLILVMCGIRIPTKGILRWKGEPVTTLRSGQICGAPRSASCFRTSICFPR